MPLSSLALKDLNSKYDLNALFSEFKILKSFVALHNTKRTSHANNFMVYPLAKLDALKTILQEKIDTTKYPEDISDDFKDFDEDDQYKVRYLVDTKYQIWFALEGAPCKSIPAHYQMTGAKQPSEALCIAAGNIQFDKAFKTIIAINHKSGDFRPSFESIKWPLAILIAHQDKLKQAGINLADELIIEQLNFSNGIDGKIPVKKNAVQHLIPKDVMQQIASQPSSAVRYNQNQTKRKPISSKHRLFSERSTQESSSDSQTPPRSSRFKKLDFTETDRKNDGQEEPLSKKVSRVLF